MWKEVVEARYAGGYSINVLFNDGIRKVVDFLPLVNGFPVFASLRNLEVFQNFIITDTLEWAGGTIDIAPEYLYDNGVVVEN